MSALNYFTICKIYAAGKPCYLGSSHSLGQSNLRDTGLQSGKFYQSSSFATQVLLAQLIHSSVNIY